MSGATNCTDLGRLLHAFVDDELDVRSTLEVEEHLGRCRACATEERSLRSLQTLARDHLRAYAPPPALVSRLQGALREEAGLPASEASGAPAAAPAPATPPSRRRAIPWRGISFALAPALAAALLVVAFVGRQPGDAPESDPVIAAHVRSLLASHLTDVASSDQHTVKPWFQGKLDYSVAVTDWTAEGYPLVGGRLDYLDEAPAAALVYRRNQHVVNLFIRPVRGGASAEGPLSHFARRGYKVFRWVHDGMAYSAVSDLNEVELEKFVGLVRR